MAVPDTTPQPLPAVRHATRVAVLLRGDLLPWQELNITAFLMSGIATSAPEMTGAPYLDADGNTYLPMLRQPVILFTANADQLAHARAKAHDRGMAVSIYTRELFTTGEDVANRSVVAAVPADELNLVGIAMHGPKNAVDRLTKGLRKHP